MQKSNFIKRSLFSILLLIIIFNVHAQTGLNFQGVARTSNNVILASQAITIKLSILQGSSTGTADYTETRRVTTNAQGLFTAVIGDTGAISTLGNFTTINWKLTPKFLKIEMDAAAGTNFITMGTTQFQYVAYAQFAKSVDAENIVGIVPVTLGGTGVNSLTGLKTALALNNVNNTTDLTKPISTLTQTALDLKLNAADTSKYTKQTYSDSALLTKLSTTGNATTATTAGNITATANTTLTSLTNLATVGTITSGVWSGTAVVVEKGGTGATTASAARTNLGLAVGSDVLAYRTFGTAANNNTVDFEVPLTFTSPLSRVTNTISIPAATTSINGYLSSTDWTTFNAKQTALTAGSGISISAGTISATGLTTSNLSSTAGITNAQLAGSVAASKLVGTDITIVGTITSGVWSGTAVAVEKGGTGATTSSAARTNLGLEIGTNIQAPLTAGTSYIVPNASITGATKTKITYDVKGLVTAGADATTADIASSTNKNYVTDAQSGVLSNTTGTNTGDETVSTIKTKLAITTLSGTNTGDQTITLTGDVTGTGTGTFTSTLANSGVSANSYGSSTSIPIFTVDAKGRVTTASTASIVADAGTLTGTTLNSTITGSSLTSVGTIASLTTGAITNSGKVIVGASSAASASAVLEASSTTQGFLPPRMTKAQRDAMVSPVAGLMIWCSDNFGGEIEVYNGSIWVNMNGFSNSTLSIGDYYQGGKIAYILVTGDPGYDATTPHGLIAAISDQSTGIRWYNGGYTTTGATGTAIGTGLSNTNTIITSQGATATSYAAGLARAYKGGGYTDWYLPSKDELYKVYLKNHYYNMPPMVESYWSSSERDAVSAWTQNFSNDNESFGIKSNAGYGSYVRAIRAF